jgi:urease accessory protein
LAEGAAQIGFACRDGRTRLVHLYERDPLRVLFPLPELGDPLQAVLVTTSGGLVGGDRLDVTVGLGARAAAHVTTSAAEKIYRSLGPTTVIRQRLTVGSDAVLEFLPPETILFDGARLRRKTIVDLAPGAGFLGGDIIIFGRRARGERFARGLLHEIWEIRRGGELVWGDALHLGEQIAATIDDPACFVRAAGCATLILAPRQEEAPGLLVNARTVQSATRESLRAGVTEMGGLLVARWLAADGPDLRRAYANLACHWRAAAMAFPCRLPRLWDV